MTRKSHHRKRAGVTLIDMIVAIGLISIFMVAAVKVVRTSLRVSNASVRSQDLGATFDGAMGQLRRDVWGATALESPDAKNLRITNAAAAAVAWTIAEDGTIARTAPDAQQSWPGVGAGMTVKVNGPVVTLLEPESSKITARRIMVASRVMPVKAGSP